MMPMSLSASAGPAVSGTGEQGSNQGFFTGSFTAATGSARATGSDNLIPMILVGVVVFLLMSKQKKGG